MLLKRVGLTLLLLTFSLCAESVFAAPAESGFLKRTVTVGEGQRGYRVYIPEGFDPKKKYPVVLWLHGSVQWGEDNENQLGFGLPAMMRPGGRVETKLEPKLLSSFIGVFPQSRVGLLISGIMWALIVFVVARLGLLAMASVQFFYFMGLFFPYTTDFSAWYAGNTIFALLVCAALAFYGFHTSTAGQPLFRGEQFNE